MHEMAVTKGLFKLVMKQAKEQNASKVVSVTLKMGDNCDYVPQIIQEYFSMLSEGTIAEDTIINANYVHTTVICRDCGREFTRHEFKDRCPFCEGFNLKLNVFNDFFMESMVVE